MVLCNHKCIPLLWLIIAMATPTDASNEICPDADPSAYYSSTPKLEERQEKRLEEKLEERLKDGSSSSKTLNPNPDHLSHSLPHEWDVNKSDDLTDLRLVNERIVQSLSTLLNIHSQLLIREPPSRVSEGHARSHTQEQELKEFASKLSSLASSYHHQPAHSNISPLSDNFKSLALRSKVQMSSGSSVLIAASPIRHPQPHLLSAKDSLRFTEPIHHVIGVVDNSGVSHGVRYYDGTGTAIPHCLSRRDEQPEETDGVKVVALAGSVHATDPFFALFKSNGDLELHNIRFSTSPNEGLCINSTKQWTTSTKLDLETENVDDIPILTSVSVKAETYLVLAAPSSKGQLSTYLRRSGSLVNSFSIDPQFLTEGTQHDQQRHQPVKMGLSSGLGSSLFFYGNSIGSIDAKNGLLQRFLCHFQWPKFRGINTITVDTKRADRIYIGTDDGRILIVSTTSMKSTSGCRIVQEISLPSISINRIISVAPNLLVVAGQLGDLHQLVTLSISTSTAVSRLQLDSPIIDDLFLASYLNDGIRLVVLTQDSSLSIFDVILPSSEVLRSLGLNVDTNGSSSIWLALFRMSPIALVIIGVSVFQLFNVKKRLNDFHHSSREVDSLRRANFAPNPQLLQGLTRRNLQQRQMQHIQQKQLQLQLQQHQQKTNCQTQLGDSYPGNIETLIDQRSHHKFSDEFSEHDFGGDPELDPINCMSEKIPLRFSNPECSSSLESILENSNDEFNSEVKGLRHRVRITTPDTQPTEDTETTFSPRNQYTDPMENNSPGLSCTFIQRLAAKQEARRMRFGEGRRQRLGSLKQTAESKQRE